MILALLLAAMPAFVPFDQVRVGTAGYGKTTFRSATPRRFSFIVLDKVRGRNDFQRLILVRVHGGPVGPSHKPFLEAIGAGGGMSGSPLYAPDGRLIGALSLGFDGDREGYALATPAEDMLAALRFVPPPRDGPNPFKPGDAVCQAAAWGPSSNAEDCGTVTFTTGTYAFLYGHSDRTPAYGKIELPVWKAKAGTHVRKFSGTYRFTSRTIGPIAGTAIFDSQWGMIVDTARIPPIIPFTVTHLERGGITPVEEYFMAYDEKGPSELTGSLLHAIFVQSGKSDVVKVRITVRLGGDRSFDILDSPKEAMDALYQVLQLVVFQHEQGPSVNSVAIRAEPLADHDLYEITAITTVKNKSGGFALAIKALRRPMDVPVWIFVPLPPLDAKACEGRTLAFTGGAQVQRIAGMLPLTKIGELLDAVADREGLYLVCTDCDDLVQQGPYQAGTWYQRSMPLSIVTKVPLPNRFFIKGETTMFPYKPPE